MSKLKIAFIGNTLSGDDGIAPIIYEQLKTKTTLQNYSLLQLGICGFDLLNEIKDSDKLIIIDAIYSTQTKHNFKIGDVILLNENDIELNSSTISAHDLGIEQTIKLLRTLRPNMEKIHIIGIQIDNKKICETKLSEELKTHIPSITKNIINNIQEISKLTN